MPLTAPNTTSQCPSLPPKPLPNAPYCLHRLLPMPLTAPTSSSQCPLLPHHLFPIPLTVPHPLFKRLLLISEVFHTFTMTTHEPVTEIGVATCCSLLDPSTHGPLCHLPTLFYLLLLAISTHPYLSAVLKVCFLSAPASPWLSVFICWWPSPLPPTCVAMPRPETVATLRACWVGTWHLTCCHKHLRLRG